MVFFLVSMMTGGFFSVLEWRRIFLMNDVNQMAEKKNGRNRCTLAEVVAIFFFNLNAQPAKVGH